MTHDDWRAEIFKTFDAVRARTDTREFDCDGTSVIVEPGVFAPDYFTDSLYFAREVPKIVGTGSLLEIGTGTGIVALAAGLHGSHGLAIDLNPRAVENARKNFARHGVHFEARQSDMYANLATSERYDFLFWNHPFNNVPERIDETLLRAGFDQDYEGLSRYIAGAREHLTTHGRLLLGTGSGADHPAINGIAAANGFTVEHLAKVTDIPVSFQSPLANAYHILELRRNR